MALTAVATATVATTMAVSATTPVASTSLLLLLAGGQTMLRVRLLLRLAATIGERLTFQLTTSTAADVRKGR